MEAVTFSQALFYPVRRSGRWAEVTEEKQKLQRPPEEQAMTHQPQGKGLGLGRRPRGSGPRPVV